ncbi:type II toxin-antitoxin system mRNA interferase toxin, RelE/StbE family [Candidatus Dojkabacteria bacterium]|nr:type II toxin-antitoxin system mRNA interferase toxin, RelE/StbE family [Candidatus Dojkabacteria bacterium]
MYTIEYKKFIKKDIRKIPNPALNLIKKRIDGLKEDPFPVNSKSLSGYEGFYRIRVNKYRVLYQVVSGENVIVVYKIGHRKDVYRNF